MEITGSLNAVFADQAERAVIADPLNLTDNAGVGNNIY